jgi:hypothetical protein
MDEPRVAVARFPMHGKAGPRSVLGPTLTKGQGLLPSPPKRAGSAAILPVSFFS